MHPHLTRRQLLGSALGLGGAAALGLLAPQARAADYKALVCVFLYGGNDGLNTVLPLDGSSRQRYDSVRGRLAVPAQAAGRLGQSEHGLHPSLARLLPLYQAGQLAVQFNVGPLYAPLSKAEYRADQGRNAVTPPSLFSHSDQQTLWEAGSTDAHSRTGWGGRSAAQLGLATPVISVGGNGRFGLSERAAPLVLPGPGQGFGAYGLRSQDVGWKPNELRRRAIDALYAQAPEIELQSPLQQLQRDALRLSERLGPLIERKPGQAGSHAGIDAAFAPLIDGDRLRTGLGRQLYQAARLIDARALLGGERQIYFAQQGGYDTHGEQIGGDALSGTHAELLKELGDALACFQAAMQALGLGQAVTLFTQSDFGRTFKPNNSGGTDHAWGNTQLVLGGAVKGGLYGRAPELLLGGPDDVGVDAWELQGRWLPSSAVDQYAATLLRWFGAGEAQLDAILPNLRNFGSTRSLGFV